MSAPASPDLDVLFVYWETVVPLYGGETSRAQKSTLLTN